ncbi:MAG TPA: BON domain-containing protein [Opitutaceae bacterium]
MKTLLAKILALTLLASTAGFAVSGCAGTATRQSTGEYIDDTTITARVKSALVSDDSVRARDVQVETFRGVVQLSGFVDTADQKARAAQLASGIAGVREVQNNISIK